MLALCTDNNGVARVIRRRLMATAVEESHVAHVGEVAGVVWTKLAESGSMSMARLVKAVGEPRDTVMQAIGWLAREDKVWIEEEGRSRIISLR
jgi:hypothetical protein